MDLTMHRVTEEHGLIESANGSIAKDTQPLRSTTKGSATSALTNSAFSWKFASRSSHLADRSVVIWQMH